MQLGTPDRGGGHAELPAAGLELEELQEAMARWRDAHARLRFGLT